MALQYFCSTQHVKMLLESIVRYTHFIAIFITVITVFLEWFLLKKVMNRKAILQLSKIDAAYGISVTVAIAAGLTLWLGVGKPQEFYSENLLFWLKFSLAILLGILSIYPTIYFIKNRKGEKDEMLTVPPLVRKLILAELLLLLSMPLLATLMANGFGR